MLAPVLARLHTSPTWPGTQLRRTELCDASSMRVLNYTLVLRAHNTLKYFMLETHNLHSIDLKLKKKFLNSVPGKSLNVLNFDQVQWVVIFAATLTVKAFIFLFLLLLLILAILTR